MSTRILLLEDNEDMLQLIAEILSLEGFEPLCGHSGKDGLSLLQSTSPLPDVILTDLSMPGVDGHNFLDTLRKNPAWAQIPCVVMSGAAPEVLNALPEGTVAILKKPFRHQELLETLHSLIGQGTLN